MSLIKSILLLITLLSATSLAAQRRIDQEALDRLVAACRENNSAGLSMWLNGKPYRDYTFDTVTKKVTAHSAHKSLISLAIGKLITDGTLSTIDTSVYTFYPEWKQGLKKTITIRHLLNHTSALEYTPTDPDGWESPDKVQYALAASLVDTPGHYFSYNDKAVDLLRGIIEKISGRRMDIYINETLFGPLGIRDYHWEYDKAGTPANLSITPAEFVKLGQLVLNKGKWEGKSLIAETWIDESVAQGQPFVPNCGLLWWRIPEKITYTVDDALLEEFKAAGVSEVFINSFRALKGSYEHVNIPEERLVAVLGRDWKTILDKELYSRYPRRARWTLSSNYIGYKAEGWLGQYIIVYPDKQLVACRMIHEKASDNRTEMTNFEQLVYELVR